MEMSGCYYKCSGGETFDSIAHELWKNEKYAADLMCANPELTGKMMFTGGEKVYLPVIELTEGDMDETVTEPETAPWRE